VESIFLKKEHKAQEEASIGRIMHQQRNSTQFIGRIVNFRNRESYNSSAVESIKRRSNTEPSSSKIKPTTVPFTD
jgi:hypothetical protein